MLSYELNIAKNELKIGVLKKFYAVRSKPFEVKIMHLSASKFFPIQLNHYNSIKIVVG